MKRLLIAYNATLDFVQGLWAYVTRKPIGVLKPELAAYALRTDVGNGRIVLHHPHSGDALYVFGGPYRNKPAPIPGVRMERSAIDNGNLMVDFPIDDFSTPSFQDLVQAIHEIKTGLYANGMVYLGCTGGFGRTGLVMACLVAAVLNDEGYTEQNYQQIIKFLRKEYTPTAVETQPQQQMVKEYIAFLEHNI